ncbi:2Fe-2S iron-sulfur cluster-binding protein [Nocardia abscessus]|jgi:ferredoxin, 2Fe-2S|uniref:2Fe-2S iron-sulfur cluster-binding protein n=1 Tax=Nocardia TaxID=1817 RepID=UPI001892EA1E|nr:2Fe-2S iron-sulfur cluster-binding protein [Nocardia abscessus]MBF6207917.1 2Fe-2S iron-sulfur cluster binding domain-containing protein [Streptomyces gardneri]MBF6472521.1 2Fe-2S iron-sulfur cluster binding domain-containing protein [Nocardia abscessus]
MTKATYTSHDGNTVQIALEPGETVMEGAIRNGVPGIVGECGGVLSCATCHVIVDARDFDRLPVMSDLENEMLDGTAQDREECSRLSCQITASDELHEIRVTTPEFQQ